MKVIIMRGIPGAGKSSWIRSISDDATIVSADYFHVGKDGVYRFDPRNASAAHDQCLKRFLELVQGDSTVIVDNTNIRGWEIAPYYRVAEVSGADVSIVRIECDPYIAARRNAHGVPLKNVLDMWAALRAESLPPWWKETVVEGR